jgi:hypothetical protein
MELLILSFTLTNTLLLCGILIVLIRRETRDHDLRQMRRLTKELHESEEPLRRAVEQNQPPQT